MESLNFEQEMNLFLSSINSDEPQHYENLQSSLKNLRVLMQKYQNQQSFREELEKADTNIFDVLAFVVRGGAVSGLVTPIVNFGLQTIVNCMVSNGKNKAYIYESLIEADLDKLKSLIEYILQEKKLVKFTTMIMNSIITELPSETLVDSWEKPQYRFVLHKLLSYFFHEDQSGKANEEHSDETFEWFYYLISNLINVSNYLVIYQKEKSLLQILWILLETYEFDPVNINVNMSQENLSEKIKLRFLYFLHNAFEKTINEKSQASLIINYNPKSPSIHELYDKKRELGIYITVPDYLFIIGLFNNLSEILVQNIQKLKESNFENLTEMKAPLNEVLDYFHAILKMFCQITFLGGYNKTVQEDFINNGAFALALKTLQTIYQLDREIDKNAALPRIKDIFEEDGYFELYLNFLRLTSNVVHINQVAQDYIYDNDYLFLLLSFTVIDANNPFIKEWSIVLIKNLTESNPKIQEKIAKLKVTDLDSKSKELLKKFSYSPDSTLLE